MDFSAWRSHTSIRRPITRLAKRCDRQAVAWKPLVDWRNGGVNDPSRLSAAVNPAGTTLIG
jgi:hypothetical protein